MGNGLRVNRKPLILDRGCGGPQPEVIFSARRLIFPFGRSSVEPVKIIQ